MPSLAPFAVPVFLTVPGVTVTAYFAADAAVVAASETISSAAASTPSRRPCPRASLPTSDILTLSFKWALQRPATLRASGLGLLHASSDRSGRDAWTEISQLG